VAAAAAESHGEVLVKRRPDHASILSAEKRAILALNISSRFTKQDVFILSYSVSFVNASENGNLGNPLFVGILKRVQQQLHVDRRNHFCSGSQSHRHRR
jgi:hypothetical protein